MGEPFVLILYGVGLGSALDGLIGIRIRIQDCWREARTDCRKDYERHDGDRRNASCALFGITTHE